MRFFGLYACAFAVPAVILFRSFSGLKFRAFAFALFSSLCFQTHTFALPVSFTPLVSFCALGFLLLSWDWCQSTTADRTGLSGYNCPDRTIRTGLPGLNCQDRIAREGQQGEYSNGTGGKGPTEQDRQNRIGRTEQA